ncbi:MAG: HDIG domain-containing protein [Bacteroidales bacterium]|nr:HDIG domain-containing protein [Bacteroidales bacterium]
MKNYRIYICFIILAALMILLYPKEGKFQYEYQKGRPWVYETLIAPIDFPILKTEAEMLREKEERASETVAFYSYDPTVAPAHLEQFAHRAVEVKLANRLTREMYDHLSEAYDRGIVADLNTGEYSDKVISVKRDKRFIETPATEVFDIDRIYSILKSDLVYGYPGMDIDSIATLLSLRDFIVPNLLFDENTTQMVHREAVNYISPTKGVIYAGQLIVSEGEIVTGDICQILDSYKAEYELSYGYTGSPNALLVSHLMTVFAILALFFFALWFVGRFCFEDLRKLVFLMLLLLLSFLAVAILFRVDQRLLYLFPFAIGALYISAFFHDDLACVVHLVLLLPLLVIPENGVELFFIYAVAGLVGLVGYGRFNRGWLQFVNGLLIFLALALVCFAFKLGTGDLSYAFKSTNFLYLAISAILTIVLYPFVFIFERVFGFVSYSRLWDLTDTNNPLLKNLQQKAPGTFQHALQVANLAEQAAREIGANAMLVRVGAMYHDIGKTENPMCFIENQAEGVNYHAGLTPEESARAIIKHVDDGLALARKAKLPESVCDFIASHHGRSRTLYFYNVYCNAGGDPANTEPFTYNGKLPETKEQVVVMMADAVEAASRSLKDYSEQSISDLVERILASRFDDSQLANADISLKEIEEVKASFKRYLQQIYHARIAYPKRKQQPSQAEKTA